MLQGHRHRAAARQPGLGRGPVVDREPGQPAPRWPGAEQPAQVGHHRRGDRRAHHLAHLLVVAGHGHRLAGREAGEAGEADRPGHRHLPVVGQPRPDPARHLDQIHSVSSLLVGPARRRRLPPGPGPRGRRAAAGLPGRVGCRCRVPVPPGRSRPAGGRSLPGRPPRVGPGDRRPALRGNGLAPTETNPFPDVAAARGAEWPPAPRRPAVDSDRAGGGLGRPRAPAGLPGEAAARRHRGSPRAASNCCSTLVVRA